LYHPFICFRATVPEWTSPEAGVTSIDGLSDAKTVMTTSLFLGSGAGNLQVSTTTEGSNTGVGINALNKNVDGLYNTAIGVASLKNNTAGYNTAIGFGSLENNTTGVSNTAIGQSALRANISGNYNMAIGRTASFLNTTGNSNIAIGEAANYYNETGGYNIMIGTSAGKGTSGNSISNNVFIGERAGELVHR
jgi:hypothetical protein